MALAMENVLMEELVAPVLKQNRDADLLNNSLLVSNISVVLKLIERAGACRIKTTRLSRDFRQHTRNITVVK